MRQTKGLLSAPPLALALTLALAACATVQTTQPGAVGIERKQTMLVSEASVEQGAQKAYATEVQHAASDGKLNADPALTARIRRITARLIPVTATFRPDAPGWNWEINTLTTPDMNAYANARREDHGLQRAGGETATE
ncbi:MAG TPA: hypothetical protein VGG67_13495 [Steroidobacteraceae bacterium]